MATRRTVSGGVSGRSLALAFAALLAAFFATNFVVMRASTDVSELSERIARNAAPSIEDLIVLRRAVLEGELLLFQYIHEPSRRRETGAALDRRIVRGREAVGGYLERAPFEGEGEVRGRIFDGWQAYASAIDDTRDAVEQGQSEATRLLHARVEPARRALLEAATRAIELNAARNREMAGEIQTSRVRSLALMVVLTSLCGVLAVAMAALLRREARTRRALADARTRELEERAAELEQFSGRVAHDIRNPLSAARTSAQLALRKGPEGPWRASVERVIKSLTRANAITDALLEFARAGARPDPGATTDPAEVIAQVMSDAAPDAAAAGIDLVQEEIPIVRVVCSEGVYLSLVGNLVRNAIKYMGHSRARRITVRVREEEAGLRTEISDTGPGIPLERQDALFEPWVRGDCVRAEGLGLGLATVKKLAESHGGSVGVTSSPGEGSTFWFVLPKAGLRWEGDASEGRARADTREHGAHPLVH